MSYCRFHNTSIDLRDCYESMIDAIETGDEGSQIDSHSEFRRLSEMLGTIRDILEFMQINDVDEIPNAPAELLHRMIDTGTADVFTKDSFVSLQEKYLK